MKPRGRVPIATLEAIIPELEELPAITPSRRPWTDREIAVLERYYGRRETKAIARALKRTPNAVGFKARSMGLSMFRDPENET